MFIQARRTLVALFLLVPAAGAACRSSSQPASVSPDVWAVVDGREIHRDAVEKAYRRTDQQVRTTSDYEAQTVKLNLLNELILQEIMLGRATELKIALPDAELEAAFNDAKKGLTDDAFNKELTARNLTAADIREELRRDLTVRKLMDQEVTGKIAVSDQEINDFYQANKERFSRAEETYHLAQIVVTAVKEPQIANRTGDDATTAPAASAKARMVMERLKAGVPFEQLAMDFSEDAQSAPRGGDVGLVPVSALKGVPPSLRDAVLKTAPGDVTMVPMEGGYTIVAIVSKEPAGQDDPSMPQVRERIAAGLKAPREQLLRTAFVNAARDKAVVVNYIARRVVESGGKLEPPTPPAPPAPTTPAAAAPAKP